MQQKQHSQEFNIKMNKLVILIFTVCSCISITAQTFRGKVVDKEYNDPLIGVSVYQKNNKQLGTITETDGSFEVSVPSKGETVFVFSYIGYETQEINLKGKKELIVRLTPASQQIESVTVTGKMKKNTDNGARFLERESYKVVNIMSAKSMELSPDINVANVLQRMSGVSLEKSSSGQGQYAILRGMDKRYNYTLINNVKIPSPDNKNRYVPLDIFPSELLDRLEVNKSLTADMESDATGGAVNMVMKDSPDNLLLQVNLATGYDAMYFDQKFSTFNKKEINKHAPRELNGEKYQADINDMSRNGSHNSTIQPMPSLVGGVAIGNRFLNNKLGMIFAGSFQNQYKGNNSLFFTDNMNQTESTVRLSTMKNRNYSERFMQYGGHLKLDYKLSEKHHLKWYNALIGNQNQQVRNSTDTNLSLNYQPDKGNSLENIEIRTRYGEQAIFVSTLQGESKFRKNLLMDWSLVYSKAKNERPDNTYITLENYRAGYEDKITASNSEKRWEHNSDQDLAAYVNFDYKINNSWFDLSLQCGGMYRHKTRDNYYVSYLMTPQGNSRPEYGIDFDHLADIRWKVSTPFGSVGPLNYDAGEDIAAGYLMGTINKGIFNLIAGVRAEYTDQNYLMYFPAAGDDPNGNQTYADILPSVNLKAGILKNMNIRASYFKSLNRPGFFEIVPFSVINEDYMEFGNKDLKRAIIHNMDLRWEYFPGAAEQIMAGFFYKKIKNPIEYAYHTINNRQFGYGPVNLGTATNFGFEIDFIKFVGDFGVKANYTYTKSEINTPKTVYGKDSAGKLVKKTVDQSRPLVGQTPHIANLSLLYKNKQYKWDIQVSASYTGEKIVIASHYLDSDYWQGGMFSLDLSLDKRIGKHVSLFAKASNLLNTPTIRYIKTVNEYNGKFAGQDLKSGRTLIREDKTGSSLLAGIRYTL